jgi:hypothetical protein
MSQAGNVQKKCRILLFVMGVVHNAILLIVVVLIFDLVALVIAHRNMLAMRDQ